MFPPPVVLDGHANARATRQPVREAGTHLLGDREEFELAPQEAVVALLRLLLAGDDRVHLGLVFRDHAVDALEHLVLLVAAIVGTRHLREADDADLLRVLDVRPSAHLGVVADRVDGDRLALGDDVLQARELVSLPLQDLPRLVGRNLAADKRLIEGDEPGDLLFDFREVLGTQPMRQVEIVIEPLVGRGPDVDLDILEQVLDGARQEVRRRMASLLVTDFF